jgi:hypothetical protein
MPVGQILSLFYLKLSDKISHTIFFYLQTNRLRELINFKIKKALALSLMQLICTPRESNPDFKNRNLK